jgi:hypothetical protein
MSIFLSEDRSFLSEDRRQQTKIPVCCLPASFLILESFPDTRAWMVEPIGIEPTTSSLQSSRSPN